MKADEMRQRLSLLVTRRRQDNDEIDALLPEAVRILPKIEVARLLGMTRMGLDKRLRRLGVEWPAREHRPRKE